MAGPSVSVAFYNCQLVTSWNKLVPTHNPLLQILSKYCWTCEEADLFLQMLFDQRPGGVKASVNGKKKKKDKSNI